MGNKHPGWGFQTFPWGTTICTPQPMKCFDTWQALLCKLVLSLYIARTLKLCCTSPKPTWQHYTIAHTAGMHSEHQWAEGWGNMLHIMISYGRWVQQCLCPCREMKGIPTSVVSEHRCHNRCEGGESRLGIRTDLSWVWVPHNQGWGTCRDRHGDLHRCMCRYYQ